LLVAVLSQPWKKLARSKWMLVTGDSACTCLKLGSTYPASVAIAS
jgi:hypothetical protein